MQHHYLGHWKGWAQKSRDCTPQNHYVPRHKNNRYCTLIVIKSAAILGGKEVNKIQPYIIFRILTKILCKMAIGNEKRIKVLLPVGGRKALTTLRARMNCDHRHRIPLLHLSTRFLHLLLGPLFFHRSRRSLRTAGIIRSHHR
jgi:hypothetical protein